MLSEEHRRILLDVADASIRHGLQPGEPLDVRIDDYPDALQRQRASFVTLHRLQELRGCIGTLEAQRPLVSDIAHNAYAAAFSDPRFFPLRREELEDLHIHISILDTPQPMAFTSEQDLIGQLCPGVDGLILEEGNDRGTFLPSVWESLPESVDFLRHLKNKAGLPMDYWSNTLNIYRYTVESFDSDTVKTTG